MRYGGDGSPLLLRTSMVAAELRGPFDVLTVRTSGDLGALGRDHVEQPARRSDRRDVEAQVRVPPRDGQDRLERFVDGNHLEDCHRLPAAPAADQPVPARVEHRQGQPLGLSRPARRRGVLDVRESQARVLRAGHAAAGLPPRPR